MTATKDTPALRLLDDPSLYSADEIKTKFGIFVPKNMKSEAQVARMALGVCCAVRKRWKQRAGGYIPFDEVEDYLWRFFEELDLESRFPSEDDFEKFYSMVIHYWDESVDGNRFKLDVAAEYFSEDRYAFQDERLRINGLRLAANFCFWMGIASGGVGVPFYLSRRTLGEQIGKPEKNCGRFLRALEDKYDLISCTDKPTSSSKVRIAYSYCITEKMLGIARRTIAEDILLARC